jgi:AraC-like DNA-binding protein
MLLDSHPTEPLKLDEIARRVCCSPYHLARLFRIATGTSLHQYRLRLRIALALEALAEGAEDLAGLALDLGFSHHSHFTATFRRLVGATPAEIRDTLSHKRLHELSTILTANE